MGALSYATHTGLLDVQQIPSLPACKILRYPSIIRYNSSVLYVMYPKNWTGD